MSFKLEVRKTFFKNNLKIELLRFQDFKLVFSSALETPAFSQKEFDNPT